MEKEILRPQYDGKKWKWRIAKKSNVGAGGWRSFGSGSVYMTKEEADGKIDFLVKTCPGQYQKE
jgi:hypothetical protein